MIGTEKAIRILKMYELMLNGREIQKAPFCVEYGISDRTFDRDIRTIRLFLSEEYSGREIQYSPDRKSYQISGSLESGELSLLELTVIIKILKSEQALEKSEFEELAKSLQCVTERGKSKAVKELIQNEVRQYEDRKGQKTFLQMFSDLLDCISNRNPIQLELKEGGHGKKKVKIFPVAVEYQDAGFYLLGYQPEEEQRLAAFLLDEIESFQVTFQKFDGTVAQMYSYHAGRRLLEDSGRKAPNVKE